MSRNVWSDHRNGLTNGEYNYAGLSAPDFAPFSRQAMIKNGSWTNSVDSDFVVTDIPRNVRSAAVIAAMHEERVYFPATIMIPQDPALLVKGQNFFEILTPGAHCDAGGHYFSNLFDQRLALFEMAELAEKQGVLFRDDAENVDRQIALAHNLNPFFRVMTSALDSSGQPQIYANSTVGKIRFWESPGTKEDVSRAFSNATERDVWHISAKDAMLEELFSKKKDVSLFAVAAIGVQIHGYHMAKAWGIGNRITTRAVNWTDGNTNPHQHVKRILPGFTTPTILFDSARPDHDLRLLDRLWFRLDALRMKPNGSEGFWHRQ